MTTVAVQSQNAAAAIIPMNKNYAAVDVNVNTSFSTLQAANSQEGDLLGIESLGRLSNLQSDDAIQFIVSHIGQFHELENQQSIKDRQLNVLIQEHFKLYA